jgi:hypothetical protein
LHVGLSQKAFSEVRIAHAARAIAGNPVIEVGMPDGEHGDQAGRP